MKQRNTMGKIDSESIFSLLFSGKRITRRAHTQAPVTCVCVCVCARARVCVCVYIYIYCVCLCCALQAARSWPKTFRCRRTSRCRPRSGSPTRHPIYRSNRGHDDALIYDMVYIHRHIDHIIGIYTILSTGVTAVMMTRSYMTWYICLYML